MQTVGIKELKQNLSRYIKQVKLGERVVITDRKKEVAVILPIDMESEESRMRKLVQKGILFLTSAIFSSTS
ncbi:type II toxin-antitoxin system Phd/YefM family antitoxin, partial [Thermodesulfobacteriota bacterium]